MGTPLLDVIEMVGNVTKVEEALASRGIVVAQNQLTGRPMVSVKGSELLLLDDNFRIALQGLLKQMLKLGHASDINRDINLVAVKGGYHPVRDYLNRLTWDGKPRIDTWLCDYMQARDTPLFRAQGALFLIGAVKRVREPGCKFDYCLVLVGKEGINKSSSLAALVPNRKWFSDSLPLGQDPKQTVEKTEGIWICESAELVGNSPTKIAEIKAFLSRQEDGPYRAAWGVESSVRPRQFVSVATNNDPVFLNSMTGNRRFWPIRVWQCDVERLEADRDQLWAEADRRLKDGASTLLPEELWDQAGDEQENFRVFEPWEDVLADLPMSISVNELYARLSIPIDRRSPKDASRLSGVMTKLGYTRERRSEGGKRSTYYRKLTPFDEEMFDYSSKNAPDPEVDVDEEEIEHDLEQEYIDRIAKIEADLVEGGGE